MTTRRHAEIAGAGFAGLTVATALAKRGWTVRVHEAAPELREFGAGIFLWENGLRVLQANGGYDQVMARCHEAPCWEDRDADNRKIGTRPLPLPGGARMITLTRRDLHRAMTFHALAAGVEVVLGSLAVAADPHGALVTADGHRWEADLVVAADGIRSAVRESLDLTAEHAVYPIGIYRFLLPMPELQGAGQWRNYVNFSHLPTGRRVLYVPCNDVELYLLLGAPAADDEALGTPLSRDVWCSTFPALAGILERMPPTPRFDRYELIRVSSWSEGRIAILGDAAHAMPPTLGQGAGTAMVNALALARTIGDGDSVANALVAWERSERPLTEQAQAAALELLENLTPVPGERRDGWNDAAMRIATYEPLASNPSTTSAEHAERKQRC